MSTDTANVMAASEGNSNKKKQRRDYRWLALGIVVAGTLLLGLLVEYLPARGTEGSLMPAAQQPAAGFTGLQRDPASHASTLRETVEAEPAPLVVTQKDDLAAEANRLLAEAAAEIKAKRYEKAISLLHGAQPMLRKFPEAYVMLGRALEGRGDFQTARDFYAKAVDLNPALADAHWGFATASESLNDLESALGGMRGFLHTSTNPDPNRLRIAQARSAIWEWESQLGRGPWGPTKGVPPGLKPEEIKRDDKGVAVLMPLPGTEQPDGSAKYEIKAQTKFQLFKPD